MTLRTGQGPPASLLGSECLSEGADISPSETVDVLVRGRLGDLVKGGYTSPRVGVSR